MSDILTLVMILGGIVVAGLLAMIFTLLRVPKTKQHQGQVRNDTWTRRGA